MKILHISTYSNSGGAAIAAKRHCEAMRQAGMDSKMLCLYGPPNEYTVIDSRTKEAFKKQQRFAKLKHYWNRLFVKKTAWHWLTPEYDVANLDIVQKADIIYLHWVNEYLGVKSIKNILELGKPVLWYMHDMWPITGGCHFTFDCDGYSKDCKHCPQLKLCKFKAADILKMKIEYLQGYPNLYAAAPSKWLCGLISKSTLFKNQGVFHVPNVIDTDIFLPDDKRIIRKKLGLPLEKKLMIFSATGTNNPYKGVKYLVEVVNRLSMEDNGIDFIVLGNSNPAIFSEAAQSRLHITGFINNQAKMIDYYKCSDILITTSLADNFPNVVIEAMACGVPAVGFQTGGIVDQIHHMENGWIVPQKDVDGLIEGINWILNEADYSSLQLNARKYVEDNCSYHNVVKNHSQILNLAK